MPRETPAQCAMRTRLPSGDTPNTAPRQVVQLTYDPKEVEYKELVRVLFTRINPALKDQVGNDRGTQYRHGVYFHTPQQKADAEAVFAEIKGA